MGVARQAQHDLVCDRLNARCEIHIALRQFRLGMSRWTAKKAVKAAVRHREAFAVAEVPHVQTKRTVFLQIHERPQNQISVLGLAVGRQAHQLVLAGIHLKAGVVREGRIEQSE